MAANKIIYSPLLIEVLAIVRARMGRLGIKNETLAAQSGLSKSQLSKIINERQIPTLDQLDILCFNLDLDLSEVIKEAVDKNPHRFLNRLTSGTREFYADRMNREGI